MTRNKSLGRDDAGRCKVLVRQVGEGNIEAAVTLSTFYTKNKLTRIIKKNFAPSMREPFAELLRIQNAIYKNEIREKSSLRK